MKHINIEDLTQQFFFDEKYLLDCHQTTSKTTKETLPGSCYFNFLSTKENAIYRRYNNVLEGLRTDEQFRCPHPITRVPAPVPKLADVDEKGNWHYYTLDQLPEDYADVTNRPVGDFCPVVQLSNHISSFGQPDVYSYKESGHLCAVDRNRTWQKIT